MNNNIIMMKILLFVFILLITLQLSESARNIKLDWKIQYTNVTRLCHTKSAVTVNGQFPGPSVYLTEGDTVIVKVTNLVSENITIHWHGVQQILSAWADGPSYITQCPIQTGASYTYKFKVVEQRGTLFWHAHISWLRSTLHGAFIIRPKNRVSESPYIPHNAREVSPIILGEWWNSNTEDVITQAIATGGRYNSSDAYTINSQPGPLYNCSLEGTHVVEVQKGRTYLLRIINAAINTHLFFGVANHTLTVVERDAVYVQPFETNAILLSPGETINVLLKAKRYYAGSFAIAANVYQPQSRIRVGSVPATAILYYRHSGPINTAINTSLVPLPGFPTSTNATFENEFVASLKSLPGQHAIPQTVDEDLFFTVGYALQNCSDCPRSFSPGIRMGTALNNYGFVHPVANSILQAYLGNVSNVYDPNFPNVPEVQYNYTSSRTNFATMATKVKVLDYGANVQIVLQDTGSLFFESHPMHLHGQNFFIVGHNTGTYDPLTDPASFNLIDPPSVNTVSVPFGGWTAIRFQALNPGAWFFHCHIEIHVSLGMSMAFITKNGNQPGQILGPPPLDLPVC